MKVAHIAEYLLIAGLYDTKRLLSLTRGLCHFALCSSGVVFFSCFQQVGYSDQRESLAAERYISPRAAGMAGTGLSYVQDWNAAFLNPALIGGFPWITGERTGQGLKSVSFPSLSANTTPFSVQFIKQLANTPSSAAASDDGGRNQASQNLSPLLESLDGTQGVHFRQQFFPNLVFGRFIFGIYQSNLIDAQSYKLSSSLPSEYADGDGTLTYSRAADIFIRSELFGVFGTSVPMGRRASLGLMARYGARTTIEGTAELGAGTEERSTQKVFEDPKATQGFSVDSGLSVLIFETVGLVGSVVGRNISEGQFASIRSEDSNEIEADPMDIDIGLAFAPTFKKFGLAPRLSLEYRNALRADIKGTEKIKIGSEIAMARLYKDSMLSLRFGYDMHAPSYGVSIDLLLFTLEGAVFNQFVKIGDAVARNETHYILRTSWDLQR